MSVRNRANWHLAEIQSAESSTDIETMGLEIDLRQSPEELQKALEATIRREARLYNVGVTCDLKMGGQSCHHCPKFTESKHERRVPLCRLGRQQEDLLRVMGGVQAVPVAEYAELAEAVL